MFYSPEIKDNYFSSKPFEYICENEFFFKTFSVS